MRRSTNTDRTRATVRDLPSPPPLQQRVITRGGQQHDHTRRRPSHHRRRRDDFFGIQDSNHGRVMIFAGGIPIKKDGKVVGAIGVSGGKGKHDQAVAEAGAAAF
ncbi:MAG: heme-binding protein [Gemmatimonadota bacterium]|nr:heme-binding protein [Gemmatimonadota bacterium]